MLILFDIDATLLTTGGMGIHAMQRAGTALFGPACNATGVAVAGRLDPLIMRDMLARAGLAPEPQRMAQFRVAYEAEMERVFARPHDGRVLPGVPDLLETLSGIEGVTLGLLTGNFDGTGKLKLRSVGLDPSRFALGAWGDDSPHDPPARTHLPPVAVERYRKHRGSDPASVVIIGDTPHDVECAKVNGHRALGVATGQFSVAELESCGADLALADLSQTDAVVSWLLGRR